MPADDAGRLRFRLRGPRVPLFTVAFAPSFPAAAVLFLLREGPVEVVRSVQEGEAPGGVAVSGARRFRAAPPGP